MTEPTKKELEQMLNESEESRRQLKAQGEALLREFMGDDGYEASQRKYEQEKKERRERVEALDKKYEYVSQEDRFLDEEAGFKTYLETFGYNPHDPKAFQSIEEIQEYIQLKLFSPLKKFDFDNYERLYEKYLYSRDVKNDYRYMDKKHGIMCKADYLIFPVYLNTEDPKAFNSVEEIREFEKEYDSISFINEAYLDW